MKRKEFLCTLAGIGLLQSLQNCSTNSVTPKPPANFSIDLTSSTYNALKTVGGVVSVQGIFIIRTSQSTYLALSNICTHQGCAVNYSSSGKRFVCPCHGGEFDMTGNVVSGPPQSPLAKYQTVLNGNTLTVSG